MRRLVLGIASAALLVTPAVPVAAEPSNAAGVPVSARAGTPAAAPLAQPATATRTRATARGISLSAPSSALTGTKVSFTGRVTSVPRRTKVKLQHLTSGTWRTRATTKTRSGGSFAGTLTVTGTGPATYRAYAKRPGAAARTVKVRVTVLRPVAVRVRADRTNAAQGAPLALSVATSAPQAGGPVQLQARTDGGPWRSAGTSSLTSSGTGTFRLALATTGFQEFRVLKPQHGYAAAATSPPVFVAVQPKGATFGQLMAPSSTEVVDPAVATWSFLSRTPSWWSRNAFVRWDTAGAFTPSLKPEPAGTHTGKGSPSPTLGAEFSNGNSSLQTADVSFRVTGTSFAIRYQTFDSSSAMVWLDGRPLSTEPVPGVSPPDRGQLNWIQVRLASKRTVHVRFAGPAGFYGVDHDAKVPLTVKAAPYRFTLGVVADSYFDGSVPSRTYEGSGAAVLHTRTGYRVWSLAQGGTGYLNDATGTELTGDAGYPGRYASPFGSAARMARLRDAPIDALLVNGSVNDAWFDNDAYAAAVHAFLDGVARIRPGLPVVIVGLEPVNVVPEAPAHSAELDTKNKLLRSIAAQHANVVGFIDPFDERWLTGSGSTAAPQGNGNQDLYIAEDHIHLSPAGQAYYQDLIADQLARLPATLSTP